jgi:hypothetical protein
MNNANESRAKSLETAINEGEFDFQEKPLFSPYYKKLMLSALRVKHFQPDFAVFFMNFFRQQ